MLLAQTNKVYIVNRTRTKVSMLKELMEKLIQKLKKLIEKLMERMELINKLMELMKKMMKSTSHINEMYLETDRV